MRRDGPLRYAQVGIAGLLSVICVSACAVLAPLPEVASLDDRLAAFPTDGLPLDAPVTVRWNAHQIPFIEAATDGDAAFTLGMVHAHLRLGQMGLVRRIVQGRLSESVSFPAANLDAAIKAFDFYRAADAIYVSMPAESRAWIDRYVAGVNTYAARVGPDWRPHEFTVAGIEWEPWTAEDAIALGRAGGVDLNWEYLLAILAIEEPALRERVAARILSSGQTGATSLHAEDFGRLEGLRRFASFTARHGRSGSNSIVVGPEKSTSGAPLIANDPHLAFLLPNPWLLAGLRTPDTAIVGMMVPGTPVFGFGRTEHIAWGGTNLRATTSQLVDVSARPESAFEERRVGIGIRYLPDRTLTVRESRFG
ncbi:MAG: penicillin acylase family protein, partial [Pseudomonadota bacterium]